MSHWQLGLFAVLVGMVLAVQPSVNRELSQHVGHPLAAAFLSFATGLLLLALICTGLFLSGHAQWPQVAAIAKGPWWMWLGGTLGVVFLTSCIYLVKPLGPTAMIMCCVAGQLTASILLENFGWFKTDYRPLNFQRSVAILLMALAIFLITAPAWRTWFNRS
jgi:transporter family-2 protein